MEYVDEITSFIKYFAPNSYLYSCHETSFTINTAYSKLFVVYPGKTKTQEYWIYNNTSMQNIYYF
jgi:hypothetical protein